MKTMCDPNRNVRVYDDSKERSEWRRFKQEEAPLLPYPQNLLFARLLPADFFYRDADNFFNAMSDEERAEVLAGVEWALSTLPTKMRLAIEYHYRDNLRPKDGGKLLGCTGKEFTSLRKRGEQRIQYIAKPVYHSLYKSGLTKTKEEWGGEMELMTPTPIAEIGIPDHLVKILQEKLFLTTIDITTTSEWKYYPPNLATCYDLPLTEADIATLYRALEGMSWEKMKVCYHSYRRLVR
jgi:hypothetical protein